MQKLERSNPDPSVTYIHTHIHAYTNKCTHAETHGEIEHLASCFYTHIHIQVYTCIQKYKQKPIEN